MLNNRTACKYGHIFTADNTYVRPDGFTDCRTCLRNRQKRWADSNRNKVRERDYNNYRNDPSKKLEYSKRWQKENPDKVRAREQRRRARKVGQYGAVSTNIESVLLTQQNNRCIYCQCSLSKTGFHRDHIIPLSRGGIHADENICLACPSCNMRKHTKTGVEFMRLLGGCDGGEPGQDND